MRLTCADCGAITKQASYRSRDGTVPKCMACGGRLMRPAEAKKAKKDKPAT